MIDVLVVTLPTLPPPLRVVRILGLVHASTVRTRGVLGRTLAAVEATLGGRGRSYASEVEKARQEVLALVKQKAVEMGANAVLGVDFETTEVLEGFILISAWGTAAIVEEGSP